MCSIAEFKDQLQIRWKNHQGKTHKTSFKDSPQTAADKKQFAYSKVHHWTPLLVVQIKMRTINTDKGSGHNDNKTYHKKYTYLPCHSVRTINCQAFFLVIENNSKNTNLGQLREKVMMTKFAKNYTDEYNGHGPNCKQKSSLVNAEILFKLISKQ